MGCPRFAIPAGSKNITNFALTIAHPPATIELTCTAGSERFMQMLLRRSIEVSLYLSFISLVWLSTAHAQTFISQPSGAQDGGYFIDEPHEGPYSEGVNQLDASRVRLNSDSGYSLHEDGALVHFPLAGAPNTITSATLRFHAIAINGGLNFYHIDHSVSSAIDITDVIFSRTQVGSIGGYSDPAGQWIEKDVTRFVQQDLSAGRLFSPYRFTGGGFVFLDLSESGQYAPSLTLVVPEPASLVALGAALLGLAAVTKRRRINP